MGSYAIAGLQFYQAQQQAESILAQGRYQKEMSEINAREFDLQKERTLKLGDEQVTEYQKKVNQIAGAQKAAYAASGVEIGYGSAQKVVQETYEIGADDAMKIKNNAFLSAMGFENKAQESRRSGQMGWAGAKTEAASTILGGTIRALTTISDSASKAAYGGG